MNKLYLVSYDVSHHSRLKQMLNTVRDYSTGGQYSCFECPLNEKSKRQLLKRVGRILEPEQDSLLLIKITLREKIIQLGSAKEPENESFIYIG